MDMRLFGIPYERKRNVTQAERKKYLLDKLQECELKATDLCWHPSAPERLRLWAALRKLHLARAVQYYRKESGQYYVKLSAS